MGFKEYMDSNFDYAKDGTWSDIASHGCDAGFSGLIYTGECVELYDMFEGEIYEALNEDAEGMGFDSPEALIATFNRKDMLQDPDTRKNLLVWYLAERIANSL